MKIRYFAAITLAACALALPALAADEGAAQKPERQAGQPPATGSKPGKMLERLRAADTNRDRQVSAVEFAVQFPNAPAGLFAELDRNGDGHIGRQDRETASTPEARPERAARIPPGQDSAVYLEKLVKQHDGDGDGRVSLAEIKAAKHGFPELVFGALDRDGDGALTAGDAAAPAKAEPKAPKAGAAADKAPKKKPAGNEPAEMKKVAGTKQPPLDVNKDGTITFEEIQQVRPGYTRERFDSRDKNGDGVLSKADRDKP